MPELIDRNAAIDKMCGDCKSGYDGNCPHPFGMCHELESLFSVPTIEAEPIVRCSECRYMEPNGHCTQFADDDIRPSASDFCSAGERRKDLTGNATD